jgi:hypothetical protein
MGPSMKDMLEPRMAAARTPRLASWGRISAGATFGAPDFDDSSRRQLQRYGIACQQSVEESASDLLVGILVVTCGVIESAEELFAANSPGASVHELVYQGADCFIVRNEFVGVASHRDLHSAR